MSLLSLFRKKPAPVVPRIQCPYCLRPSAATEDLRKCTACQRDLPKRYREHHQAAPPLFLPMMGLPSTGKTTFLFAATLMVVEHGSRLWPPYLYLPLTDETDKQIENVRKAMATGQLPKPTPLDENQAYILQLLNLPRWGRRTWVIRDVPGEHFAQRTIPPSQVPFVTHTRTAFLFYDFNSGNAAAGNTTTNPAERTVDFILRAYVMGLEENGVKFRPTDQRQIVVVLTKADQLDLPPSLKAYLAEDDHWPPPEGSAPPAGSPAQFDDTGMALYMERLGQVSNQLGRWVRTQPGGQQLFALAQEFHLKLHFCMISAIPCGVEPGPDGRPTPRGRWQEPLRVLDPFYWALELNSEPDPAAPRRTA